MIAFVPIHLVVRDALAHRLPQKCNVTWRGVHYVNLRYWRWFHYLLGLGGLLRGLLGQLGFLRKLFPLSPGLLSLDGFLGFRVSYREDCRLGDEGHLLLSVYGLDSDREVFALHGWWRSQTVGRPVVSGVDAVRLGDTVLLGDEQSVPEDWRASSLRWLFPLNHGSFLGDGPDLDLSWWRNTNRRLVCFVEGAVSLDARLVKEESTGISDGDAMRVDSMTTPEAEGDPVLLTNVRLVKWKVHLIHWPWVLWRVNLHMSQYLLISLFAVALVFVDIPL